MKRYYSRSKLRPLPGVQLPFLDEGGNPETGKGMGSVPSGGEVLQSDTLNLASPPVTWRVSDLVRQVRNTLEQAWPVLVRVRGEISNLSTPASGHIYFVLKDAESQVRCVLWKSRAQLLRTQPKEGMSVEVSARVTLFEGRGEFQLSIESLAHTGAGALFEAFIALKERLAAEGLFAPERKRVLPTYSRAIGVITSREAAALRDVLTILRTRSPMIPVIVYPTPVQGSSSVPQVVEAIKTAGIRMETDILILCRGGGSLEDLWTFNEESVARAIINCPIPIISGIGHETDFTIADFVSDVRAPTPTAAAVMASPDRAMLLQQLIEELQQLQETSQRHLREQSQSLDRLREDLVPPAQYITQQKEQIQRYLAQLRQAMQYSRIRWGEYLARQQERLSPPSLSSHYQKLQNLCHRLQQASSYSLAYKQHRWEEIHHVLLNINPEQVLARGYSIVRLNTGEIINNNQNLSQGTHLHIQFHQGDTWAEVIPPQNNDKH